MYIKDMGGSISDAFGGIGPILLPMAIAGAGIIISIIGTMLVKIKDNAAKEAQVMGALNIGNWTSIAFSCCCLLWISHLDVTRTMNMYFFGELRRRSNCKNNYCNACILCNSSWFSCWCCHFFCN